MDAKEYYKPLKYFSVFIIFFGLFHLFMYLVTKYGSQVNAYDVIVNTRYDRNANKSYSKAVYYYVVDNNSYTCTSEVGSDGISNTKVYYSRFNPTSCKIEYNLTNTKHFGMYTTIFGIILLIISLIKSNSKTPILIEQEYISKNNSKKDNVLVTEANIYIEDEKDWFDEKHWFNKDN